MDKLKQALNEQLSGVRWKVLNQDIIDVIIGYADEATYDIKQRRYGNAIDAIIHIFEVADEYNGFDSRYFYPGKGLINNFVE